MPPRKVTVRRASGDLFFVQFGEGIQFSGSMIELLNLSTAIQHALYMQLAAIMDKDAQ